MIDVSDVTQSAECLLHEVQVLWYIHTSLDPV